MEEARNLAQFAKQVTYADLPKEVIDKAKELILDQLGCQLAGSTLPWSKATYKYIRDYKLPREESTIVNYGLRTIAQDAAFANANFGHGFVADDTDPVGGSHPGAIIISAALAVGEREMISGEEFIGAVVVGYDVTSRVGSAAPLAGSRGFHGGPVFGPLGVAASTGLMLGLDEEGILNAIGIAASHSSGVMEYSRSGGTVNRLHAGISAYGGIRAALLAQRGFSGPPTILEGERGLCRAFSGETSLDKITRGLGSEFRILKIGLKPYCCCGTHNAGLDAISKIASEHAIAPKEIKEIMVSAPTSVMRLASTIIEPWDITSAQFSGRFGMALRLLKGGNGFKEYTEENLRDPEILGLVAKINYQLDEDLQKAPGADNPSRVKVTMRDGTTYEETVYIPKGGFENPMTKEEVHNKFREFASMVFPDYKVEKVIETVAKLEELDNIRDLAQLLIAT